ncbi:polysaccharide lyase [Kitasatospora sp. NPDC094015]|uniref:polysaccharide lyase n=1 Tax=Kitasatospora sp. NPDC094015 TaxID=3155205 RepID=UPI00332C79E0
MHPPASRPRRRRGRSRPAVATALTAAALLALDAAAGPATAAAPAADRQAPATSRPHRTTQPPTPTTPAPTPTASAPAPAPAPTGAAWSGGFAGYGSETWRRAWGVAGSGSWGGGDLTEAAETGVRGGAALRVRYGARSSAPSCTDCADTGGGQFSTDLRSLGLADLATGRTLDLRYRVRFPAGHDWGKAGKLPGLYGGPIGEASGGNHGGWSTRFMWRGRNGVPDNGEVYVYTPAGEGYGVDSGLGSWTWPADDRWHTVEQLVDRTTGDVTVWFDGRQVHSAPGVVAGIGSIPFGGIFFSTFYGGHEAAWGPASVQYAYFADFSLSAGVQH